MWTEDDQRRFEADSFERIAKRLGLILPEPRERTDAEIEDAAGYLTAPEVTE